MPTYSYACTACDDRFDAVQAFSDASLTTCSKCDGRLRKLFGKVGVVFKGSGFYRNDSREPAKASATSSSDTSSSDSTSSSASEKKSDKKESGSSSDSSSSTASASSTSSATVAAASN